MHRYGQKKELMEWNAVQEVRGGGDGGGGAGGRGFKGSTAGCELLRVSLQL